MDEVNIWRMQTRTDNETDYEVSKYCIENGVLAIGWSLKDRHLGEVEDIQKLIDERKSISLGDEEESFKKYKDFVKRNKTYEKIDVVKRLKSVKPYDLVWMRDNGVYWLGLVGPNSRWLYDSSEIALKMDVSNQRTDIKWFKIGGEADVAGVIATSFIQGSTLQRINQEGALEFSQNIINTLYKRIYDIKVIDNKSEVFFNLISPNDCEDLFCMWLFKEYGYVTIPSTCKKSTELYECVLINPKAQNNKEVYIQVKKGDTNLYTSDYKHLDGEVYLFTTRGEVIGERNDKINVIDPEIIFDFVMDSKNDSILPSKIIKWRQVLLDN